MRIILALLEAKNLQAGRHGGMEVSSEEDLLFSQLVFL